MIARDPGRRSWMAWPLTVAALAAMAAAAGCETPHAAGSAGATVHRPVVEVATCRHSDLEAALAAREAEITDCAARAAAARPGRSGRVSLRWAITPFGHAKEVSVLRDDLNDQDLARCLMTVVATTTFPPARGGECLVVHAFDVGGAALDR